MARVPQPDSNIPEEFLKGKNVNFYKAYFVGINEKDKKLDIHREGDIFFLTQHNAVEDVIIENKINSMNDIEEGTIVVMIDVIIKKSDLDLSTLKLGVDLKSINIALKQYDNIDIKIHEYVIKECNIVLSTSGIRTLEELIMDKI